MSAALVCVAKLEEKYLHEWVQYYLHIGFDRIYLYDNSPKPIYEDFLKEYEKVTVIHFPSIGTPTRTTQQFVLDDFCANYKDKHTWVAHFDVDEFLVLKKHKTILEFCQEYLPNEDGGIVVPWVHFGDNGHKTYSPEPVTFRFTMREDLSQTTNVFVKSIMCTACIDKYVDWHIPNLKKGVVRTTDNEIVKFRHTDKKPIDVIQLNHYFCKSLEEFHLKRIRGEVGVTSTNPCRFGKADHGRYGINMFNRYNKNQIEDLYAKQTYEECLRQRETPQ